MLTRLLDSEHELIQRQSAKALANLGVNTENKKRIADEGALPKLVRLASAPQVSVKIEAIAALANLAVNGKYNGQRYGHSSLAVISLPTPPFLIVCFVGWLVGWLVGFRLERIKNCSARWSRPYSRRAACGREYIRIRRLFQVAGRDA